MNMSQVRKKHYCHERALFEGGYVHFVLGIAFAWGAVDLGRARVPARTQAQSWAAVDVAMVAMGSYPGLTNDVRGTIALQATVAGTLRVYGLITGLRPNAAFAQPRLVNVPELETSRVVVHGDRKCHIWPEPPLDAPPQARGSCRARYSNRGGRLGAWPAGWVFYT